SQAKAGVSVRPKPGTVFDAQAVLQFTQQFAQGVIQTQLSRANQLGNLRTRINASLAGLRALHEDGAFRRLKDAVAAAVPATFPLPAAGAADPDAVTRTDAQAVTDFAAMFDAQLNTLAAADAIPNFDNIWQSQDTVKLTDNLVRAQRLVESIQRIVAL